MCLQRVDKNSNSETKKGATNHYISNLMCISTRKKHVRKRVGGEKS